MLRKGLFIITCSIETDGYILANYLQSHPDILCHLEIYNLNGAGRFSGVYGERIKNEPGYEKALAEYMDKYPIPFLYKIVFDAQKQSAVGFIFKYQELLLPQFAITRNAIKRDRDIKIIHLRRRNLLRLYLLQNLNTCTINNLESLIYEPVYLDPISCVEYFSQMERMQIYISKFFSDHQVYNVDYEDIISDHGENVLSKIQEFIDVPIRKLSITLKKQYLYDLNLKQVIANFNELQSYFKDTPYEQFLKED